MSDDDGREGGRGFEDDITDTSCCIQYKTTYHIYIHIYIGLLLRWYKVTGQLLLVLMISIIFLIIMMMIVVPSISMILI